MIITFVIFYILLVLIYIIFFIKKIIKYHLSEKDIKLTNKNINQMLLYGTHNSLTYKINNYFSQFAKTQTLDLQSQIKYGIRFFDLRFKIIDNQLKGFHAFIDLNINHIEIFNIFINFLKNNKDEFLIITMKNEEFKNHNLVSEFLYNNYIKPNNLESYFLFNNNNWKYIPTIEELKNKIFILNHTMDNNKFVDLPWGNNTDFYNGLLYISDTYKDDYTKKLISYENFIYNCKQDHINIFFSSFQYSNILGVKYNNTLLLNKIKISKDIPHIFVMDFCEDILKNH